SCAWVASHSGYSLERALRTSLTEGARRAVPFFCSVSVLYCSVFFARAVCVPPWDVFVPPRADRVPPFVRCGACLSRRSVIHFLVLATWTTARNGVSFCLM